MESNTFQILNGVDQKGLYLFYLQNNIFISIIFKFLSEGKQGYGDVRVSAPRACLSQVDKYKYQTDSIILNHVLLFY